MRHRLHDMGVRLHLSEVKGPVMDRLAGTDFLAEIDGVHLSQHQAMMSLREALGSGGLTIERSTSS